MTPQTPHCRAARPPALPRTIRAVTWVHSRRPSTTDRPSRNPRPGTMFHHIAGLFRRGLCSSQPTTVSSASTPAAQQTQPAEKRHTHLVVLVHGLFGTAANWVVIKDYLHSHLDPHTTLIYVSTANQLNKTFDGIDICGERLADEVRAVVEKHPSLKRLSLVGHSMGGLINRYAAGRMFDPHTCTICGLRPCHFVTMATPHLGCDGDTTPAQVPFVGWAGAVPAIGGGVQRVLQGLSVPFAAAAFGRAGAQFFLADRDGGASGEPLLLRMTRDCPSEGYFHSALAAFETRTAYANRSGDHLVGWANSSLRSLPQLPKLRGKGLGVVREDPLEEAWHPEDRPRLFRGPPSSTAAPSQQAERSMRGANSRASGGKQAPPQQPVAAAISLQASPAAAAMAPAPSPSEGAAVLGERSCGDAVPASSAPQVLPLLVPSQAATASGPPEQPSEQQQPAAQQEASSAPLHASEDSQHAHHAQQQRSDTRLGRLLKRAAGSCGGSGQAAEGEEEETVAAPNAASPAAVAAGNGSAGDSAGGSRPDQGSEGAREVEEGAAAVGKRRRHSRPDPRQGQPHSSNGASGVHEHSGPLAGAATAVGAAAVSGHVGAAVSEGGRVAAGTTSSSGGSSRDSGSGAKRKPHPLEPGPPRAPRYGPPGSNSRDRVLAEQRGQYVEEMLERLQQLPWRRVDVCFGRSVLPFLSHQHIQVQRWWANWEGRPVAKHLAATLAAMEVMSSVDE